MKQPLWYVRRDGKLVGPHPRQVVIDSLLLGRFGWDDPASRDGRAWQPLKMYPEILSALEPAAPELTADPAEPPPISWHGERLAAARRWADERSGIDRRTAEEAKADDERRSLDERRKQRELLQVVLWRRLRRELSIAYDHGGSAHWWGLPLAGVLLIALCIALWQREPATIAVSLASRAANCAALPAPEVNWSGCDRSGAQLPGANLRNARLSGARFINGDLQRADLVYADLSGSNLAGARLADARLFGANLTGADLGATSFDGADLSFADLRNARLDGTRFDRARLGNAIWSDGRRCAPGSVGRCD